MKERKKHPIFWAIMIILFVAALVLWVWTRHGGPKIYKVEGIKTVEYNNATDMLSNCDGIRLPSNINILSDNIQCSKTGSVYQILESSGAYIIKITESSQYYFAIDPFELEGAKTDERNFVEGNANNIRYIRIRTGCIGFENCTSVNWDDEKYTYALIIGDMVDKTEVLDILGIKESELKEFIKPHFKGEDDYTYDDENESENVVEQTSETTEDTYVTESDVVTTTLVTTSNNGAITTDTSSENAETPTINIDSNISDFETEANKISIDFPNTSTEIIKVPYPGAIMYSMGGKVVLAVVYDKNSDIFEDGNEIKIKNNMAVRYLSENPFDKDEEQILYNDYEKLYNNMASIANSVKIDKS